MVPSQSLHSIRSIRPAHPIHPVPESRAAPISLSGAVISGFAASVAMLFAFAAAYGLSWLLASVLPPALPVIGTLRQWCYGLIQNALIDLARPNLYAAMAVYFAGGIAWAILYAAVFHRRLHGPDWRRGLLFSLVPWLFSLAVFLPLAGGGFFGLALGAGPLPILGNLILHAVYGATLGEVYGPHGDTVVDEDRYVASAADLWANQHSQTGAARGLVGGLLVGGLVWLVLVGPPPQMAGSESALAADSLPILLTTTVIGGALGALLGSLAGLSSPSRHR
jgi:hypothetical protein